MDISDRLDRGERLLWQGAPPQGLMLRSNDVFLIPFSLVWTGFAVFWTLAASGAVPAIAPHNGQQATVIFPLFGSAFIAVGLMFTFGRFFADAWRRDHTQYALTDKRAIIAGGWSPSELSSMPLSTGLQVDVSGGDTGSIRFGPGYDPYVRGRGLGQWLGPPHPFMFERIADVGNVYKMVRQVQSGG